MDPEGGAPGAPTLTDPVILYLGMVGKMLGLSSSPSLEVDPTSAAVATRGGRGAHVVYFIFYYLNYIKLTLLYDGNFF